MKLVTPPLIIEESDAFKNDVLNRKEYGEALRNLVKHSNDELVISLDGKWGEGKTTFIKMWQGMLSEDNIPHIYIDAFKNDYIDDAFITVASAITTFVEENIKNDKSEKAAELKENLKSMSWNLLSWTTKLGVKLATLGIIKDSDIDELKDIKSELSKGTSNLLGNVIEEALTSQSKDIALIEEFRVLLSEIPSSLEGYGKKPLVIIIDELDRCKPSFAIEMLEKVKHLFSVKNVVFILIMNKEQLEESVRCIYGQNIDAHSYLQKFINIETQLPKRVLDQNINDLKKYSLHLFKLHEIDAVVDENTIIGSIVPLAKHFNLSLRQLEKVFTNLAIFYGTCENNDFGLPLIVVFISVIKTIKPKVFDNLLQQNISFVELREETGLTHSFEVNKALNIVMNWVHLLFLTPNEFHGLDDKDMMKQLGNSLAMDDYERERIIVTYCQRLNIFTLNN